MDEVEKDTESNRAKERSPSPGVKSTAVVKYTAVQSPAGYSQLQCNTDLNLPPSNWSAAIDSYGLRQILTTGTGLSSFRMAHMFPDSVGEVDVISGAECIKKLLKLPYQPKGTVSMMVHRVENTLLLDDFDVYDYLMKSEWPWLKEFFYENILKTMTEQQRMTLMIQNKASSALQLSAKFLFHSVASLPQPQAEQKDAQLSAQTSKLCLQGPHLPEPEAEKPPESESHPPTDHSYNRNVLWTFEDIQMLIGSDLPIFGGNDRPCVSLRLRDARDPINVLTGIDYWLDNLMCNVPEVLMCYHLDGIVQKYEPMKTEELPNLENSKFSPKVIRNVAQNILSFLKSNATKAGHTYWLFKGPDDDVVKLYDLTSLCPENMDNPFTTPVAMLLYRVARNMRLMNRTKHVKQLLEQTIQLLDAPRYPQIVASSHYMLGDLYLPQTTNPAEPDFREESSSDTEDEDEIDKYPGNEAGGGTGGPLVQMRGLALRGIGERAQDAPEQKNRLDKDSKLGVDPPSRCGKALQHALRGLMALHHVTIDKCKEDERERLKQQIILEEQHPKMANPFEPITMHYESINKARKLAADAKEHQSRPRRRKKEKKTPKSENYLIENNSTIDRNAIQIRNDKNVFPTWNEPNRDDNFAWKMHLKTLLYEKICLAYATLAEYSYAHENYGFSLKYIDMASKCQKLLSNMIIKSRVVDSSCLIGRVGDNYFQLSKHWDDLSKMAQKQFTTDHDVDIKLRIEIENDMTEEVEVLKVAEEFDLDISLPTSSLDAMLRSCEFYKRAIAVTSDSKMSELQRRLASVNNELGARGMAEAQDLYVKYQEACSDEASAGDAQRILAEFRVVLDRTWQHLQDAAETFQLVGDVANLALLHCNLGRFKRLKAHCGDCGPFDAEIRDLYSAGEEYYEKALKMLGPWDTCGAQAIWDVVAWERSSHTYTKACFMQDTPTSSFERVGDVIDSLKHALKHCLLGEGKRQYLYQFRAAMIHHRLGSLYHSQFRMTTEDGAKRRTLVNATRANYEQAANMFAMLEETKMLLRTRIEHVAMLETLAQVSPNLKLKSLQSAIQILRQCHSIMELIKKRDPEEKETSKPEEISEPNVETEISLITLFTNRLQHILKHVIQYCRTKSNKDYEKMTDMYKKFYCASLRINRDTDVTKLAASICEALIAMDDIAKEYE